MDDRESVAAVKLHRKLGVVDYASESKVKQTLIEAVIFFVFLVVTTIVALSAHHRFLFFYNNAIERLFVTRPTMTNHGMVYYDNLATTAEWFCFLENNLLLHLFENGDDDADKEGNGAKQNPGNDGEKTENGLKARQIKHRPLRGKRAAATSKASHLFLEENLLLGVARLRQIRVKDHSCEVHEVFSRYFDNCYDSYHSGIESKESEFQGTKFHTINELNAIPIWGKTARYIGGGYVQNLANDRKASLAIIAELKKKKWADRGTRLLIIEFVLYNANTDLLNNVKFMAEHLPTGGIIPSWRAQAVLLPGVWALHRGSILVAVVLFYLLVIFYTAIEGIEIFQTKTRTYFSMFWNYVDLFILLSAYIGFALTIIHPILMAKFLRDLEKLPDNYHSLDVVAFCYTFYICIMGLCAFLVWIKIFRYLSFNKTMSQFSATLKRCAKDILSFGVMFLIVYVAFALLGMLLFGTVNSDFQNFKFAILTMMRMILCDFNYQRVEKINPILGPIFFVTYIMLVFLILLNMFLAIINDTYIAVRTEITQERSVLKSVLKKMFQRIGLFFKRCCKKSQPRDDGAKKPQDGNDDNDEDDANPPAGSSGSKPMPQRMSVDEFRSNFSRELPFDQDLREDVGRLNERVDKLESVLEKLIDNMDGILQKVETKKKNKQKAN